MNKVCVLLLLLMLTSLVQARFADYAMDGSADNITIGVYCIGESCQNATVSFDFESYKTIKKAARVLGVKIENWSVVRFLRNALQNFESVTLPEEYTSSEFRISYRDRLSRYNASGRGYIIQFREEPIYVYRSRVEKDVMDKKRISPMVSQHREMVEETHTTASKILTDNFPDKEIDNHYKNVFNGLSINISDEEALRVGQLDFVREVYPVRIFHTLLNDSVDVINADDVWLLQDSQGRNVTGQNVTVAIIDTGTDYTHVDFGSCNNTNVTGVIEDYQLESAHPYNNSFDYTWNITKPGYTNIAVHFSRIDVESGWDYVYVMNSSGSTVASYTGSYTSAWSLSVPGDTIKIRLKTDSIINDWGFAIDKVINGNVSFSWNCEKIVGGYDFYNEDDDPMDDNGHGTHVAGTVAANGTVRGVAPGASLMAFKVCSSAGSCPTDDILAGIDRAIDPNQDGDYSDHVDVISMSLGGMGDPDDELSQAVDNAVDAGIVVVVAAGNDGPGTETISSPACARKALAVGATYKQNTTTENRNSSLTVVSDNNKELPSNAMKYSNVTSEDGISTELLNASWGYPVNFSAQNFTNKIALIERGSMDTTPFYFYEKVNNAHDAGAAGVIIYSNEPGNFLGTLINDSALPTVSISQSNGTYLLGLIENETVRVNLTVTADYVMIAEFSSRGPSYIYNKPDVVAPGVNICSTQWADAWSGDECIDSEHTAISGTSMATPHVAGVVALILQKHPDWTPLQVKSAIENNANDLGLDRNTQGAGMVDALAAVQLNTTPPVALILDIPTLEYKNE